MYTSTPRRCCASRQARTLLAAAGLTSGSVAINCRGFLDAAESQPLYVLSREQAASYSLQLASRMVCPRGTPAPSVCNVDGTAAAAAACHGAGCCGGRLYSPVRRRVFGGKSRLASAGAWHSGHHWCRPVRQGRVGYDGLDQFYYFRVLEAGMAGGVNIGPQRTAAGRPARRPSTVDTAGFTQLARSSSNIK